MAFRGQVTERARGHGEFVDRRRSRRRVPGCATCGPVSRPVTPTVAMPDQRPRGAPVDDDRAPSARSAVPTPQTPAPAGCLTYGWIRRPEVMPAAPGTRRRARPSAQDAGGTRARRALIPSLDEQRDRHDDSSSRDERGHCRQCEDLAQGRPTRPAARPRRTGRDRPRVLGGSRSAARGEGLSADADEPDEPPDEGARHAHAVPVPRAVDGPDTAPTGPRWPMAPLHAVAASAQSRNTERRLRWGSSDRWRQQGQRGQDVARGPATGPPATIATAARSVHLRSRTRRGSRGAPADGPRAAARR